MVFNSINYFLFLFTITVIFYLTPHKYRWVTILIGSVVFYLSFIPIYILVLFAMILMNYFVSIEVEKNDGKKRMQMYLTGIVGNIAILILFKYFNFFEINFLELAKSLGLHYPEHVLKVILPLGLSFFAFSSISYLIEVKRGNVPSEKHLGIFAAYLLFFPKLMQGPIERPQHLIPQFHIRHVFDHNQIIEGLKLLLIGFFKKLVVADRLAIYVNAVYGNADRHNGTTLLLATFFYSIQIYADFSGYTDIARGTARILGFNLTNNFNRPYFSKSIKEFWSRWHISLSNWLRDYLFLPLAFYFSKKMPKQNYLGIASDKLIYIAATMITFTVCGLWHGEGLNYLIWGALFGLYLSFGNITARLNRNIRQTLKIRRSSRIKLLSGIFLTFSIVTFTWIFFRAFNLSDAVVIIKKIFTQSGSLYYDNLSMLLYSFIGIIVLLIIEIKLEYYEGLFSFFNNDKWLIRNLSYAAIVILILLIGVFDGGQFIYFQF